MWLSMMKCARSCARCVVYLFPLSVEYEAPRFRDTGSSTSQDPRISLPGGAVERASTDEDGLACLLAVGSQRNESKDLRRERTKEREGGRGEDGGFEVSFVSL